ncbi:NAD(P)/FAD-dependent oxidoreductase [Aristaeella lactis]|uniref:Thioredoxin reductase (NADPH) n=1 Tax=Aristaeella lactis TaxID=3046383 RepID=A0AC61PJK7_9FIRM|nr:NAD(P)/FAD-dependent oxidoreductase [Aristaeella lactis]QUA51662.1 NAD(P)/FAD-dependent oxidoreductase [Aristaeella lactis]SMC48681.1 thioredoxin reductase (NADPH) [Aristaeella lactis]
MERYDIAIIGTGPAGVSAALTAKNRNKSILLLGSRQMSEKVAKAHEIRNYPGLPLVKGADLAAAFREQLDGMDIPITESRIGAVYAMGDYFALQAGEEMLEAKTVILATGVVMAKTLPGEEELLGRGVSYCATCDAPLYRGRTAAVIGYSPREETEAAFLAGVCSRVMYFPMYADRTDLPETVEVIREKPEGILKAENGLLVKTAAGEYAADGVFVLREAVAPGQLVPGLETDGAHVKVNRKMETNLPGVFACGDLTGTPYQYVKAAGEGNVAAISAAAYIDKKTKE